MPRSTSTIFTIGHSTRPIDEFIAMLTTHGVMQLADVRQFPASRRHPQFNHEALAESLAGAGIVYRWFESLGGRRKPLPIEQSRNRAWKNDAFRGYADYMQTAEFADSLAELQDWARRSPTAIMCAEAIEWQCHRRLIADALVARGWSVRHIHNDKAEQTTDHNLPEFARVDSGRVLYPRGTLFDGI